MLMLPASPAAIHGQKPRALGGAATVIGADHVAPMSFEYAYWIAFACGEPWRLLPVSGGLALVGDALRRAGVAAVGRLEDLVGRVLVLGVGGQEDLVLAAAGQPRTVAVVAVRRAAVPRLAAVGRREQRVVGQVDAGVVDPASLVRGQVRVREAEVVRRIGREARALEVDDLPGLAVVLGGPHEDLVAVVDQELQ